MFYESFISKQRFAAQENHSAHSGSRSVDLRKHSEDSGRAAFKLRNAA